jgi:hypothetical protein
VEEDENAPCLGRRIPSPNVGCECIAAKVILPWVAKLNFYWPDQNRINSDDSDPFTSDSCRWPSASHSSFFLENAQEICGHYIKKSGEVEVYTTGYMAKNQEPNTTTGTQALTSHSSQILLHQIHAGGTIMPQLCTFAPTIL